MGRERLMRQQRERLGEWRRSKKTSKKKVLEAKPPKVLKPADKVPAAKPPSAVKPAQPTKAPKPAKPVQQAKPVKPTKPVKPKATKPAKPVVKRAPAPPKNHPIMSSSSEYTGDRLTPVVKVPTSKSQMPYAGNFPGGPKPPKKGAPKEGDTKVVKIGPKRVTMVYRNGKWRTKKKK